MKKRELFTRDFAILVAGQVLSLFGNAILRFALSLYVLDVTGSAAVFGGILAASMVPMVLFSPVGGILADRVRRQRMMVVLDYTTGGLLAGFALFLPQGQGVVPVAVLMLCLAAIQSFYQPSVQSSIPLLVGEAHLAQANGTVVQVNALANLIGPIAGGFLYGFFGLWPILLAGIACFLFSATMELFLHIPFVRRPRTGGVLAGVRSDLGGAVRFLGREQRGVLALLAVVAGINLALGALLTVGLPYLVKIHLGLGSQLYGFVEGAMAVGSILGGLLAGTAARRWPLSQTGGFLLAAALCTVPLLGAVVTDRAPYASYAVILGTVCVCMCCTTLFSVIGQTYIQQVTPTHMLGKVMSLVTMLCTCAYPLGQALYGGLFQALQAHVWVVVLIGGACGLFLSLAASRVLARQAGPSASKGKADA